MYEKGFFFKKLTEYSNHYLDWSQTAALLRSGHHYSRDQLMARARITGFAVASGLLAAYFNDSERTDCSHLTLFLMMAVLGGVLSHTFETFSLWGRRIQISRDCSALQKDILQQFLVRCKEMDQLYVINGILHETIETIMNISLSDNEHGRATQTWGFRQFLLKEVRKSFDKAPADILAFWQDDLDNIFEKLLNGFVSRSSLRR